MLNNKMSGYGMKNRKHKLPIVIKLRKGMCSDNGATPWYGFLYIGSEKQKMKMAFDTGTDHSWVTSNRCTTDACLMHQRFDIYLSETYNQISSMYQPKEISFGPWGAMFVSMGQDNLILKRKCGKDIEVKNYRLNTSEQYDGEQFMDLIWDGAIGIPSIPSKNDTSELVNELLKDAKAKHKTLYFNYKDKTLHFGKARVPFKSKLKVVIPMLETMKNLWFLRLNEMFVNNHELSCKYDDGVETKLVDIDFCIDTGSSRFKGDPLIINAIIDAVTYSGRLPLYVTKEDPDFIAYPELVIFIEGQRFTIEPKHYFEKIAEELYVLAFHPMKGLDNILLAGSVFLEKYNPVFYFNENMNGTHISLIKSD